MKTKLTNLGFAFMMSTILPIDAGEMAEEETPKSSALMFLQNEQDDTAPKDAVRHTWDGKGFVTRQDLPVSGLRTYLLSFRLRSDEPANLSVFFPDALGY